MISSPTEGDTIIQILALHKKIPLINPKKKATTPTTSLNLPTMVLNLDKIILGTKARRAIFSIGLLKYQFKNWD
jgi:hypothetical protein